MKKYIMAFDAGTTSNRSLLFDSSGRICATAQKEFTQYYPQAGYVEHDAAEIWQTQFDTAFEAMEKAGAKASDIAAIGITNQRETAIVWDKATGEPVCPAIVWQCRRTAAYCDELKAAGLDKMIRRKTGLLLDAYFSATKLKWILDHVEGARERAKNGELLFGTVDCWLIWKLTGGRVHATDYSNVARTMLYDIHEKRYDKEILELLDIPEQMLPEVRDSSGFFGETTLFGDAIPVCGVAGDQQAALFGQTCFTSGDAKNTYGTGCFLLMNTGDKPVESKNGLLTTIAWGMNGKVTYALEGSVFIAGAVIQWLRDELKLIKSAKSTEKIAAAVPDSNGVYIVPAFVGLGAPYWDQYARGTIVGLTRGANRAHIVRAALESMAYQTRDVLRAMQLDSGITLKTLNVDGGASANNLLMQFQSDILGVPVRRPKVVETTATGAAYLAGISCGFWKSLDGIIENRETVRRFEPNIDDAVRQKLCAGWEDAVARAVSRR